MRLQLIYIAEVSNESSGAYQQYFQRTQADRDHLDTPYLFLYCYYMYT